MHTSWIVPREERIKNANASLREIILYLPEDEKIFWDSLSDVTKTYHAPERIFHGASADEVVKDLLRNFKNTKNANREV